MMDDLLQKIDQTSARIGIIGLGYVGLPLAVEFGKAGFSVTGFDVDPVKVKLVNAGENYIQDVDSHVLAGLAACGKLRATSDFAGLQESDCISICVPTPLRKTKDPDLSYIIASVNQIKRYLHRDLLIVLESTTYPGTTDELIQPELVSRGFTIGRDIFLAFSPERVDPGNPHFKTQNTPKVIGGVTPECTKIARALYQRIIPGVVPVSSTRSAEMVKLLENTFRSVNIGLVNEMAVMCDKLGIDVWEVIDAAATKPFGFMKFYPGPGLGGHCIPIDPHYLSWKLKALNYNARFIELAGDINSHMPDFVVEKLVRALNSRRKCLNGSRVLVLGIAYKKDVNDVRESPALDVIQLLRNQQATVFYHDPYIPEIRDHEPGMPSSRLEEDILDPERFTERVISLPDAPALSLHSLDAVVITTDHSCYNPAKLMAALHPGTVVMDARHMLGGFSHPDICRL